MFSVEILIHFHCPHCSYQIKRRFLDYLSSRTTRCPSCQVKLVHLARGETPSRDTVEMDEIRRAIERLEGDWGCLVNEYLTHQSREWGKDEPGLAQ